jgi:hypothetical protein
MSGGGEPKKVESTYPADVLFDGFAALKLGKENEAEPSPSGCSLPCGISDDTCASCVAAANKASRVFTFVSRLTWAVLVHFFVLLSSDPAHHLEQ